MTAGCVYYIRLPTGVSMPKLSPAKKAMLLGKRTNARPHFQKMRQTQISSLEETLQGWKMRLKSRKINWQTSKVLREPAHKYPAIYNKCQISRNLNVSFPWQVVIMSRVGKNCSHKSANSKSLVLHSFPPTLNMQLKQLDSKMNPHLSQQWSIKWSLKRFTI